jgi:hypothetical protein
MINTLRLPDSRNPAVIKSIRIHKTNVKTAPYDKEL